MEMEGEQVEERLGEREEWEVVVVEEEEELDQELGLVGGWEDFW